MASVVGHHPAPLGLGAARRGARAVAAVVQAALWASSTTSLDDAGVLRTADQQSRRGNGDS
jgi:hypothetical protein